MAIDLDIAFGEGIITNTDIGINTTNTVLASATTLVSQAVSSSPSAPTEDSLAASIMSLEDQANFDRVLDDSLGYLDPAAPDYYRLILPDTDVSDLVSVDVIVRRKGTSAKTKSTKKASPKAKKRVCCHKMPHKKRFV